MTDHSECRESTHCLQPAAPDYPARVFPSASQKHWWFVGAGVSLGCAALSAAVWAAAWWGILSATFGMVPVAAACWWGFRHYPKPQRVGWLLVGYAVLSLQIGHISWRFLMDIPNLHEAADSLGWMVAAALSFTALSSGLLILQERNTSTFWRHYLDGLAVSIAVTMAIWSSQQVGPWVSSLNEEPYAYTELGVLDDVLWTTAAVLVVVVGLSSLLVPHRRRQPAGVFAILWVVLVFVIVGAPGVITDLSTVGAPISLVIALAVLLVVAFASRGVHIVATSTASHEVKHPVVVYVALLVAILIASWGRLYMLGLDVVSGVLLALLTVALLARNIITHRENVALVTQLREREQYLVFQNNHDQLTGLHSRDRFFELLHEALTECAPEKVAVVFLDLDKFKQVNDTYGHSAGDELLTQMALRLQKVGQSSSPAARSVARLAGDEFALLVAADDAQQVAAHVVQAVREPVDLAVSSLTVTCSVGVAFGAATKPGTLVESILARADQAMYSVKHTTTNGYRVLGAEVDLSDRVVEARSLREAQHPPVPLSAEDRLAQDPLKQRLP